MLSTKELPHLDQKLFTQSSNSQEHSSAMSTDEKKVYSLELRSNDMCLKLVDPKMPKTERMKLSVKIPEVLEKPRPLTTQELQESGYTMLRDQPVRIKSKVGQNDIEYGFCRYLSPRVLYNAPGGLWPMICRIQYILADPDFIDCIQKSLANHSSYLLKRGTCYDLGCTTQPGHRPGGIRLGQPAKACNETLRELNILMAQFHQGCVKLAGMEVDHSKHWAANASITSGHHQSRDATQAQVNYSKQGDVADTNMKSKAHVHVDPNDDPTRHTVMPLLSNLDPEIYEGLFALTGAKLCCPGERFGAFVFTGRTPHAMCGFGRFEDGFDRSSIDKSQRAPEDAYPALPDHFFKGRISLPIYCRNDSIHARPIEVHRELWSDEALVVFGTKENHETWKARMYIKENIDDLRSIGVTADELVEQCFWLNEEGGKQHPDRDVIQLCLDWAGKPIKEYEELHKAALYAGCGTRVPELDENGEVSIVENKLRKNKRKNEDGTPMLKVRCPILTKSTKKQCTGLYWPDQGTMCTVHTKVNSASVDDGDEAVSMVDNYISFQDMVSAGNFRPESQDDEEYYESDEREFDSSNEETDSTLLDLEERLVSSTQMEWEYPVFF